MNFEGVGADIVVENDPVAVMLGFVGFTPAQVVRIRADGFDQLEDMGIDVLEEQDITSLADSMSRQPAGRRISFGIARTKRLIGMMHWVQDHERVSLEAAIVVGTTEEEMRGMWSRALERANSRKAELKHSKATQAAADPGELTNDKGFYDFESAFENYLSTIPGQNGVPLSYVGRVETEPTYLPEIPYSNFTERMIACAPHHGAAYIADKRKVHQLVISHLSPGMQLWIEPVAKKQDGRLSITTLRNHCTGTGNVSRRVSHAESLKKNLYYSDEKRGTFNSFLQKMSKMFTIFKDEGEPMAEEAKIRVLFEKINHPELKQAIAALEIQHDMSKMTYMQITNHLSTRVSKLGYSQPAGKFHKRNVSQTNTGRGKPKGTRKKGPQNGGIMMPDNSIWTGFYPNWKTLPEADKQRVQEARTEKKAKRSNVSEIKSLIREVSSLKRKIKASKSTVTIDDVEDDEDEAEEETPTNAGTQFGGRNKKKGKKS